MSVDVECDCAACAPDKPVTFSGLPDPIPEPSWWETELLRIQAEWDALPADKKLARKFAKRLERLGENILHMAEWIQERAK